MAAAHFDEADGGVMGFADDTVDVEPDGADTILTRVCVSEQGIQKCLLFDQNSTVWTAKQIVLDRLARDLDDKINYGLYLPASGGRAGKFLAEERLIGDYSLQGPVATLEFKYKRRVYLAPNFTEKMYAKLHSKSALKRFLEQCAKRNVQRVTELIAKGTDPNFHDEDNGETPLTLAVMQDHVELITVLVEGGGHTDFRAKDGMTPVHKAAIHGMHRALQALLDLGASPDFRDANALTPLYHTCVTGGSTRCAELLLQDRAQIGVLDKNSWSEVHQATKHGHSGHVHLLCVYGADVNAKNRSGNTPLHVAATWAQLDAAQTLLTQGADRHIINAARQTAAQIAVKAGALDVARLLSTHPEVDAQDLGQHRKYIKRTQSGSLDARRTQPRGGREIEIAKGAVTTASSPTKNPARPFDTASKPNATHLNVNPASGAGAHNASPQVTLKRRLVEIDKGLKGYGFRLEGAAGSAETQSAAGQVVSSSEPTGPAYKAGLRVGDRVMTVNGIDVLYASHQRVVDLVRLTKGTLMLEVGATGLSPSASPKVPHRITHRSTNIDSGHVPTLASLAASADPHVPPAVATGPPPPPPQPSISKEPPVELVSTRRNTAQITPRNKPENAGVGGMASILGGLKDVKLKKAPPLVEKHGGVMGCVVDGGGRQRSKSFKTLDEIKAEAASANQVRPAGILAGILDVKLKKTSSPSILSSAAHSNSSRTSQGGLGGQHQDDHRRSAKSEVLAAVRAIPSDVKQAMEAVSRSKNGTESIPPVLHVESSSARPRRGSAGPPTKPKPKKAVEPISEPPTSPDFSAVPPPSFTPHQQSTDLFDSADVIEMPSHVFDFTHKIGVIPPPPGNAEENFFPETVPPPSFDENLTSGEVQLLMVPPPPSMDEPERPAALDSMGELPPMPSPGLDARMSMLLDDFPPPPPDFPRLDESIEDHHTGGPIVSDHDVIPPPTFATLGTSNSVNIVEHVPTEHNIGDEKDNAEYLDIVASSPSPTSPVPKVTNIRGLRTARAAPPPPVAQKPPGGTLIVPPARVSELSGHSAVSSVLSTSDSSDDEIEGHTSTATSNLGRQRAPPPPPTGVSPTEIRMVITAFAFEARNTDELSFQPGEKLELMQSPDGGWWKGKNMTGSEGWFPSNHARELVTPPSASKLPAMSSGPGSPPPQHELIRSKSFSAMRSTRGVDDASASSGSLSRSASQRDGALSRKSKSDQDLSSTSSYLRKPAKLWSVVEVGDWLGSLGLDMYRPIFSENAIAGEHLLDLDKGDLKELGVTTLGHRMTISKGLSALRATSDDSGEDSDTYHC
eukprot:m.44830 g.44830  ORF g.44830 m.44830 type:complete len:1304 (+) comp8575_c0_seq1:211-4122(+)